MNYNFWYKPLAIICLIYAAIPFFAGVFNGLGVLPDVGKEMVYNLLPGVIHALILFVVAPLAIIFYLKRKKK